MILGDIFRKKVESEKTIPSVDAVLSYTEIYHRLLRDYKTEIQYIEETMQKLREERELFYLEKLPAIKETIINDDVCKENCEEWIHEIQNNMEKSFCISERLIQNYITDNLDKFKEELKSAIERL